MKKTLIITLVLLAAPLVLFADTAPTRTATITIRDGNAVVWSGPVSVPDSDAATTTITATDGASADTSAASVLAALVAADAAQPEFSISNLQYYSSFGSFYLKCITGTAERCDNWQYVVNGAYPSSGLDQYILHDGDAVYLYFGSPRRFSLLATTTVASIPVDAFAESYDYTDDSWHPLARTVIGATQPDPNNPWNPTVVATTTTGSDGRGPLSVATVGTYDVGLEIDYYASTTPLTVRDLAENEVLVRIRNGSEVGYQGVVSLSNGTTTLTDSSGIAHDIAGSTPLAALWSADQASSAFSISDIQYYASFGAFYIKCITLSTQACDDWQYAVNGTAPNVGADAYTLSGGEQVYFFFGSPRRVSLSSSSVTSGTPITATAETYTPANDTYAPAAGLVIGATRPDPANPWSPIEIATSTSGADGQAIFTLSATGTYAVGLQADSYFPSTPLTVTDVPPPAPPTPSGGGGGGISYSQLNVPNALAYLVTKQRADGSFGVSLFSDWAALAFAASLAGQADRDAAKATLRNYLLTASPALSAVTDYERHAMALMSLGINPYSGTQADYITPIVSAFDGTQIGDAGLDNDDIFALFPLLHAGYSAQDDIIQKTAAFTVSRQQASGAWDSSVDITAAAVQALSLVPSLPNVSAALAKAEQHLRSEQQPNGGWGNSFSTSWVLQAIAALGQSPSTWAPNGYSPNDYLASLQQSDGGVEPSSSSDDTRVWATEYAIVGALGKTWSSLLSSFAKPPTTGGEVLGASASTSATSAASMSATTTSPIATSTPPATANAAPTSTPSATTTAPKTTSPKPTLAKAKTPAAHAPDTAAAPAASPTRVATAASAQGGGFFSRMWQGIVGFFRNLI